MTINIEMSHQCRHEEKKHARGDLNDNTGLIVDKPRKLSVMEVPYKLVRPTACRTYLWKHKPKIKSAQSPTAMFLVSLWGKDITRSPRSAFTAMVKKCPNSMVVLPSVFVLQNSLHRWKSFASSGKYRLISLSSRSLSA
jgi:hypothetical protein